MKTKTLIISDYPFAPLRATEELALGVKSTFLLHQHTGVVCPIVQGKDWIVMNLMASLRRAARKGIGTMMRQPKKLWAPLGDGDLTPLRDGAPLNLGNPRLSTRFADAFPDALVSTILKSINKVLRSGTRSTITSRIPLTSWT